MMRTQVDSLKKYLDENKPDVLVVSETGLDEYYALKFPAHLLGGYTISHLTHARQTRNSGVSLLVNDRWLPFLVNGDKAVQVEKVCALYVTVRLQSWNMHIIGMYGSPHHKADPWLHVNELLEELTEGTDRVLVIGDLNVAPDPDMDRLPKRDNPTRAPAEFVRILEERRYMDAWREKHYDEVQFTYFGERHNNEADAPRSRIDLALVSPELRESVLECEIHEPFGDLTPDHRPLMIEIQLPEPITNMPPRSVKVPTTQANKIDVQRLKDKEARAAFQAELTEESVREFGVMPALEAYTKLLERIMTAARKTLGEKTRTIRNGNVAGRGGARKLDASERTHGHCCAVTCSATQILGEMRNAEGKGEPVQMPHTKAMKKLMKHVEQRHQLSPPPVTKSFGEAAEWFEKVKRLKNKLADGITRERKEHTAKRIEEAITRADENETNNPKQWFRAKNLFKSATQSTKKQSSVINEVDPPQTMNNTPVYEDPGPKGERVPEAIGKYFAHLAKERTPEVDEQAAASPQWFTARFDAARREAAAKMARNINIMEEITAETLESTLKTMPDGKATGPDGVATELISALPPHAMRLLARLFSSFLSTGDTPQEWRACTIFTLHKGGDIARCSNYRPISLQSTVYKAFATILTKRLSTYCEAARLLSNAQGGFRKGRSCLEKVELLTRIRRMAMTAGWDVHILFADVKKAYDTVPIDRLVETLRRHHLDQKFVSLVAKLYENNTASVTTVFGPSPSFPVQRGLKQGCPMSPILFNLFLQPALEWIDDMLKDGTRNKEPLKGVLLAFADDLAIVTFREMAPLQAATDMLQRFLFHNGMELGVAKDKSKTVYMTNVKTTRRQQLPDLSIAKILTRKQDDHLLHLVMSEERVSLPRLTGTESYRYLGVWWNVELDWEPHLKRAQGKLYAYCMRLKRAHFTTQQSVLILNRVIMPAVSYGLEVIRPDAARVTRWDNTVSRVINKKIGVHWASRGMLYQLPIDLLGLGLVTFEELTTKAIVRGCLTRGLNSRDTELALLTKHQMELLPDARGINQTRWVSLQNTATPLYVRHNPAYNVHGRDVGLLFGEDDKDTKMLREKKINTGDDLIDENGNVKEAVRQIPELADAIRRITIPSTNHATDVVIYRMRPEALSRGSSTMPHFGRQSAIRAYSDGSRATVKGKIAVGYGVFVTGVATASHASALPEKTSIMEAEARGLSAGIALHDPARDLEVYTDSKGARDWLLRLLKTSELPRRLPLGAVEPLQIAKAVIDSRKTCASAVHHVPSHTTDQQFDAAETERRKEKLQADFGDRADEVAHGNAQADAYAKRSLAQNPPNLMLFSRAHPRYLLFDSQGNAVSDSNKHIRDAVIGKRVQKMHTDHKPPIVKQIDGIPQPPRKTYPFVRKHDIDGHASAKIVKEADPADDRYIRFIIRMRLGLIADKQTRLVRQDDKYHQGRYGGVKVTDDTCDRCKEKVETRYHFCVCAEGNELRKKITEQVKAIINKRSEAYQHDVPCFWAIEQRHKNRWKNQPQWKEIEEQAIEQAAMGIIPKPFVIYLKKSIKWLKEVNVEEIVSEIQRTVITGFQQLWKDRCEAFQEAHKQPRRSAGERAAKRIEARTTRRKKPATPQKKQVRKQRKRPAAQQMKGASEAPRTRLT